MSETLVFSSGMTGKYDACKVFDVVAITFLCVVLALAFFKHFLNIRCRRR